MSTKSLPPSRTADQFVLRMPDGMRDRIAQAAERNGRSMNNEIIHRLGLTLPEAETPLGAEILDTLREAKLRILALQQRLEAQDEGGIELDTTPERQVFVGQVAEAVPTAKKRAANRKAR
jgi:hypothetical protein